MPARINSTTNAKTSNYRKINRNNGDLVLSKKQRFQWFFLIFLIGFFFIWYKGLLFDGLDSTKSILQELQDKFTQEPFILIFVIAPLIFIGLILQSQFSSTQNSFTFKLSEKSLFKGNRKLCTFDEIKNLSIKYNDEEISNGKILVHLVNEREFVIFKSTRYDQLSLIANEIATLVHVIVDN